MYETGRRLPGGYADPDHRDAYNLASAAYRLAQAGEYAMSEAAALKAAALMSDVVPNENGDKVAGDLTYYHYGILSIKEDYCALEVPAPPFAIELPEPKKKTDGPSGRDIRRIMDDASLRFGWYWLAAMQVRAELKGTPGKIRTNLSPGATLKQLIPILKGYSPDLPLTAQYVLGEKAMRILDKNPCGNYGTAWQNLLAAGTRLRGHDLDKQLVPANEGSRGREYCAITWFENKRAEEAAKTLYLYRQDISRNELWRHYKELSEFEPRSVSWPEAGVGTIYGDTEDQKRHQELNALFSGSPWRDDVSHMFIDGSLASMKLCEILRFHHAVTLSGSEYLDKLSKSTGLQLDGLEVPEDACIAMGMLSGAARSHRTRQGQPVPEDMARKTLGVLRESLEYRKAKGQFKWELMDPEAEKEKKEETACRPTAAT